MSTDPQSPAISAIDAPLLAKDAEIAALKERLAALSTAAKTLRERYERLRNSPSEASDGEESDQELRERALTLAARLERKGRENLRQKGELLAARGEAEELGTPDWPRAKRRAWLRRPNGRVCWRGKPRTTPNGRPGATTRSGNTAASAPRLWPRANP